MLFSRAKKDSLANHEKAVSKYNATIADVQNKCELLYSTRQQSVVKIEEVERLINSITNTPKEFKRSFKLVKTARINFCKTEDYAGKAYKNAKKSGIGVAAGVGAGATVAFLTPTAAMWVATTFGKASTGTAISTLSGAVANKAALAWLGGGALKTGSAGIGGGLKLIKKLPIIGWIIAAIAALLSVLWLGSKNKKISNDVVEETKILIKAEAELNKKSAIISNIHSKTSILLENIKEQLKQANKLERGKYSFMSNDEQLLLGALVNNALSLAEMLNKTVE